jgi:hypothetical protein
LVESVHLEEADCLAEQAGSDEEKKIGRDDEEDGDVFLCAGAGG